MKKPKRGKSTVDGSPSPQSIAMDSIESLRDYMKNKFSKINDNLFELTEKMATIDCITSLMNIADVQTTKIDQLEAMIAIIESYITHLKEWNEAAEQYQRRLSLRINGIDFPSN